MVSPEAAAELGFEPETPAAIRALLSEPLDELALLVYVKDRDGRYVRVNACFLAFMETTAERVLGQVDQELPPLMTIDGPRLRDGGPSMPDSAQLSYIVGAVGNRPGLSVWRFALPGPGGELAGTCGVAAPVDEAHAVSGECERLLALVTAAAAGDGGSEPDRSELALVDDGRDAERERAAAEARAIGERVAALTEQVESLTAELAEANAAGARAAEESDRNRDAARQTCAAAERDRDAARQALESLRQGSSATEREHAVLQQSFAAARERLTAAAQAEATLRAELEDARQQAGGTRQGLEAAHAQLTEARARVAYFEQELASTRERLAAAGQAEATLRAELDEARQQVGGTTQGLEAAHAQLAEARRACAAAEHERDAVRQALESLRQGSSASEREYAALQQELASMQQRLTVAAQGEAASRAELVATRDEAAALQQQLVAAREELSSTHELLAAAQEDLDSAQQELGSARTAAVEALEASRIVLANDRGGAAEPLHTGSALATAPPARNGNGAGWGPPAQRALAAGLAAATEWSSVLKTTVKMLGTEGGWRTSVAWTPDPRSRRLRCSAMWVDPTAELQPLETATWQQSPAIDSEPVVSALHGAAAVSVSELDPDDRRLAIAREYGMRFAVCVRVGPADQPIAFLELMTDEEPDVDPLLALALDAVAIQLAQIEQLMKLGGQPRWALGRV